MKHASYFVLLTALTACTGVDSDNPADSGLVDPTESGDTGMDTGGTDAQSMAVVTTRSSDGESGSFATIALDDLSVNDQLFVVAGDAAVTADAGQIFQMNRLGTDTARMYTPGEWTAPQWERELPDNSNPGAADVCGGRLFIALYGTDTLGVYDPATGNQTGVVDLSLFSDGDEVGPEPGTLVEVDGKLYVGMNRLDRENYWTDAGGAVAEVDCQTNKVIRSWDVGGNTRVAPWPGTGQLLVIARPFGDDDGGIYALDPASGPTYLTGIKGEEIVGVAATSTHAIAISLAADFSHYARHCIDLQSGKVTETTQTQSFYTNALANDRGEAWITAGPSWLDDTAPQGIFIFDIDTCSERAGSPLTLSLAPSDISFY